MYHKMYKYLWFCSRICMLKSATLWKAAYFVNLYSSVIYATIYIIEIKSFQVLFI